METNLWGRESEAVKRVSEWVSELVVVVVENAAQPRREDLLISVRFYFIVVNSRDVRWRTRVGRVWRRAAPGESVFPASSDWRRTLRYRTLLTRLIVCQWARLQYVEDILLCLVCTVLQAIRKEILDMIWKFLLPPFRNTFKYALRRTMLSDEYYYVSIH